jgi:hypothetical protein
MVETSVMRAMIQAVFWAAPLGAIAGGAGDGRASERDADDDGDRTRDGWGQDFFHGFMAEGVDDQTGCNRDQTGHDDAKLGLGDQGIRSNFAEIAGAGDRDDSCDVGETGTVVERDFAAGNEQEADGGKAAGKNSGGDVKASQQGNENGGREHDQDLLEREEDQLPEGRTFIGQVADDKLGGITHDGSSCKNVGNRPQGAQIISNLQVRDFSCQQKRISSF